MTINMNSKIRIAIQVSVPYMVMLNNGKDVDVSIIIKRLTMGLKIMPRIPPKMVEIIKRIKFWTNKYFDSVTIFIPLLK